MDIWEYRGEVISVGSYNAAMGGTSAGESRTILVKRLNVIGAEGWQLRSLERMSYVQVQGTDGAPSTFATYYNCVFMRPVEG
jgi:hypothetical protein